MKGIILAGGTGTRLWPLTRAVSKQLLPVFDKPMVFYPLATLMESGIREILIICRPDELHLFERLLGDGSSLGLRIAYAHQERPDGIAAAFRIGQQFLEDGFGSVTLILGDNFLHGDAIGRELSVPREFQGARIFAYDVRDPSAYGVVEFDGRGSVRSIVEKPVHPASRYAIPGLYVYDEEVVDRANSLKPSMRGELEISDLNNSYLTDGRLEARVLPRGTAWLDMGSFEALLDASAYVRAIEARQSRKVGCLEEAAWRNGWISDEDLQRLAQPLLTSGYGQYLMELLGSA